MNIKGTSMYPSIVNLECSNAPPDACKDTKFSDFENEPRLQRQPDHRGNPFYKHKQTKDKGHNIIQQTACTISQQKAPAHHKIPTEYKPAYQTSLAYRRLSLFLEGKITESPISSRACR